MDSTNITYWGQILEKISHGRTYVYESLLLSSLLIKCKLLYNNQYTYFENSYNMKNTFCKKYFIQHAIHHVRWSNDHCFCLKQPISENPTHSMKTVNYFAFMF